MTLLDELSVRICLGKDRDRDKDKDKDKEKDNVTRITLLGIGNRLRGDDCLGPYVIDNLVSASASASASEKDNVMVIDCGEIPEAFTQKIISFAPTHIIMVDSAKMGEYPGAIRIVDMSEIKGLSLSTHQLPLNILAKYLQNATSAEILLIGVEPKNLDFSGAEMEMSGEVRIAAEKLTEVLKQLFTLL